MYSNSLLGGVPLPPTRFSTQGYHVAAQSKLGVGITCLVPLTNYTIIFNAFTADKRVDVYGSNLKNVGVCEVGGEQQITTARRA